MYERHKGKTISRLYYRYSKGYRWMTPPVSSARPWSSWSRGSRILLLLALSSFSVKALDIVGRLIRYGRWRCALLLAGRSYIALHFDQYSFAR